MEKAFSPWRNPKGEFPWTKGSKIWSQSSPPSVHQPTTGRHVSKTQCGDVHTPVLSTRGASSLAATCYPRVLPAVAWRHGRKLQLICTSNSHFKKKPFYFLFVYFVEKDWQWTERKRDACLPLRCVACTAKVALYKGHGVRPLLPQRDASTPPQEHQSHIPSQSTVRLSDLRKIISDEQQQVCSLNFSDLFRSR